MRLVHLHGLPGCAALGYGNALGAAEVLAGGGLRVGLDLLERALRHHLPAVYASAGAHVDDAVGGTHHVFIVLHHDHAVANVAQVLQRGNQPVVVALVQANTGLVQHIHHARQAAANLACQANALRFTARERVGAAVQAQIIEAHVQQEAQARGDLVDHLFSDVSLVALQLECGEPVVCL